MSVTVSIIIGSESDLELANKCADTLNSLSIPSICLAHGNELIVKNSSKKIEEKIVW